MTYELKAGEYVKGGKLYGWTGQKCSRCSGYGERPVRGQIAACPGCGGTGDEHGLMPAQPTDLPPDTE